MSDQPIDPVEARLSEELASRAAQMPIRGDGMVVIQRGVRRRHRNRVVAWGAGALVLAVAVVGGTALGTRSDGSAPYVDTTGTTSTTDPDVPTTIPAQALPALAPSDGSGFDWQVASWSGPSAYMLAVHKSGASSRTLLLRVQTNPWNTTSTETTPGPDGQVVTIDRSGTNGVDLSWEIGPGVTASVAIGSFPNSTEDPVKQGLDMIATLDTVEPTRWRDVVRAFFEPSWVLIDDPSSTALGAAMDPVSRGTSGETTVNIWAPRVGWGQLTLDERNGLSITPEGEPVSVRGLQGTLIDYVATSDGSRIRTLQWAENRRTYALTFGAEISLEQAVAVANQLHLIRQDQVDQLLFPTWQPSEMPEMQPLPQGEGR